MIKTFTDDLWPFQGITHQRITVRAIAEFQDKLVFLKVNRDDLFGTLSHLETLGGGIEAHEDKEAALKREILEESGYHCEILAPLCVIEDTYNALKRRTVSHFYAVRLIEQVQACHFTDDEKKLHMELVTLSPKTALDTLSNPKAPIEKLIYQRDLFAYQCYRRQFHETGQ